MSSKYGFSQQQWQAAKEEMRTALIETAKRQTVISRKKLAVAIQSIRLDAYSSAMSTLLKEVALDSVESGAGILPVLIVEKNGDMQPYVGFFELAKELGRDTSDFFACWSDEIKKVYAYKGTKE